MIGTGGVTDNFSDVSFRIPESRFVYDRIVLIDYPSIEFVDETDHSRMLKIYRTWLQNGRELNHLSFKRRISYAISKKLRVKIAKLAI